MSVIIGLLIGLIIAGSIFVAFVVIGIVAWQIKVWNKSK